MTLRRDHLIFCLLAGIAITVMVAVAAALVLDPTANAGRFSTGGTYIDGWGWQVTRTEQWGTSFVGRVPVFAGPGALGLPPIEVPVWSGARRKPASDAPHTEEVATGWPFRALRTDRDLLYRNRGPMMTEWRWSYEHRGASGVTVVPLRPLPLGFAGNSLTYGAALYLLLVILLPKKRGERRAKRGRCPTCGYDLKRKLDEGCPECGWGRPGGPPGA